MRNALTTKQLYEKLLEMPDLHSIPELDGEILIWKLYENAYVRAYCDSYDTCIDIISASPSCPSTHWHPDEEDMFDQLYSLGKKGNVLVLKRFADMLTETTSVFYVGEPDKYRFDKNKKWHWGKLFYLEQSDKSETKMTFWW